MRQQIEDLSTQLNATKMVMDGDSELAKLVRQKCRERDPDIQKLEAEKRGKGPVIEFTGKKVNDRQEDGVNKMWTGQEYWWAQQ